MDYIHVRNLEKFQPKYKDGRRLLWIRWDIDALTDYKLTKLLPEQKWLFLGLICLEVRAKKEIPWDENWLAKQLGFVKNRIHKHLLMLQTLELIEKVCNEMLQTSTSTPPSPSPTIHNNTNNTDDTNNISQVTDLLNRFSNQLKEKALVYIERNRLKNKSKVITEGRKQTLLLELLNTQETCGDNSLFEKALDCAISYDACNMGYVATVIKNKKAKI